MHPPSIVGFELSYAAKILIAAAISVILWRNAGSGAGTIVATVYSLLLLSRIALIWFAIRYATHAVRVLVPVMFAASCVWALAAVGTLPPSLSLDLIIAGLFAEGLAVFFLFQAGAYYWFNGYIGPKPFGGSIFD